MTTRRVNGTARHGRVGRLLAASLASTIAATLLGDGTALARSSSSSPPQLVTIAIPDPQGYVPPQWLSYPGPPKADVWLPAGYDPNRRYPLLVLLNGLNGSYDQYVLGGMLPYLNRLDAIVVMPEGGSGWYTDWWNDGERGSPAWESYFLNDVIPQILARFPILPQRRYHALAGFSMGGLGAAYLGGRLPGFFGSVGSLSGFVDPQYFAPIAEAGMWTTSEAAAAGNPDWEPPLNGDDDMYPVYGPPYGFYADGHNPTRLATNLGQTRVFESTGNGVPSGAGLSDPTNGGIAAIPEGSALERLVIYPMSQLYHHALVAAGVDVTYQVHPGGHDWPDFYQEMMAYLAWDPFRSVVTDPNSWVNYTVATEGQLWDISYEFAQPPTEVVQFRQSGTSLSITSAGSDVTVTTSGGCVIHTSTPATLRLARRCQ